MKEQKDALENGLVSMEDVQMAVAEGTLLAIYRINNQFSPSTVDLSSI
jgi:hypothetical protein